MPGKSRTATTCGAGKATAFPNGGCETMSPNWCAHEVSRLNRRLLRLDCGAENTKLCAYYESLGFVRVGLKTDGIVWSLYEKPVSSASR